MAFHLVPGDDRMNTEGRRLNRRGTYETIPSGRWLRCAAASAAARAKVARPFGVGAEIVYHPRIAAIQDPRRFNVAHAITHDDHMKIKLIIVASIAGLAVLSFYVGYSQGYKDALPEGMIRCIHNLNDKNA